MEQRFEPSKFWHAKSNVDLSENSDGFELVPEIDVDKAGYTITPLNQENFKVLFIAVISSPNMCKVVL